jgi:hypothetical protein
MLYFERTMRRITASLLVATCFFSCLEEQDNPLAIPTCSLQTNQVFSGQVELLLTSANIKCSQQTDYYEIIATKQSQTFTIRIAGKTIPSANKVYTLSQDLNLKEGYASLTNIYYNSTTKASKGELFLTVKNGKILVEICSASMTGTNSDQFEISCKILCP